MVTKSLLQRLPEHKKKYGYPLLLNTSTAIVQLPLGRKRCGGTTLHLPEKKRAVETIRLRFSTIYIFKMSTSLEIVGNVRERFIQAAALLRLIDPVRAEPTVYGLDEDSPNLQSPRELVLKRKFLDSFALICATRKNGDSVSAACLEEGGPTGTIVRIASNSGVSDETLSHLRNILGLISSISST